MPSIVTPIVNGFTGIPHQPNGHPAVETLYTNGLPPYSTQSPTAADTLQQAFTGVQQYTGGRRGGFSCCLMSPAHKCQTCSSYKIITTGCLQCIRTQHQSAFDWTRYACMIDLKHPWYYSPQDSLSFTAPALYFSELFCSNLPSHHTDSHRPNTAPAPPGHPAAAAKRRWGWENIITFTLHPSHPPVMDIKSRDEHERPILLLQCTHLNSVEWVNRVERLRKQYYISHLIWGNLYIICHKNTV